MQVFREVFHEVFLKLGTSITFNTLWSVYRMIGQLLHFDSSRSETKSKIHNVHNLIWEKGKSFKQQKVTKGRNIRHGDLPKCSDMLWKMRNGRRLCQNISTKSSSTLYVRSLPRRLPGKSTEVWLRYENHAYPKALKWLQNRKKLQK